MTRYFYDTEFIEGSKRIDLISIGIVADDGREYYAEAVDSQIPWDRAVQWVLDNVRPHLLGGDCVKPLGQIADEVRAFCKVGRGDPIFWAYCGAYDWVVLNQLYGLMVDHPKEWAFFCNDIAQLADSGIPEVSRRTLPEQTSTQHNALEDARWNQDAYKWIMARKAWWDRYNAEMGAG